MDAFDTSSPELFSNFRRFTLAGRWADRSSAEATATQALVQQQVAELQAAASQNASHSRELAAQLQTTLATLEQAALDAEARLRGLRRLCLAALATAAASLALAVFLLLGD